MSDPDQFFGPPDRWGLYDPSQERESCGVGLIAHLKGWPSHRIVLDAHQALRNMHHRGACGCEPNTGDGAGVTTALPHDFLAWAVGRDLGKELPEPGRYAAGLVFLPTDPTQRRHCRRIVDDVASTEGLHPLGWRKVPTEAEKAGIGPAARCTEPRVEQVLIGAPKGCPDGEFERRLYRARKRSSRLVGESALRQARMFHVCSLSSRILVYKGMLTPDQLDAYYPDLTNPLYATHVALVHSRFSTNTFPSWNRAQPMRWMCHNGEINTLRGNKNWFRARQGALQSPLLGDLRDLHPILEPDCSDSGTFDNMLEFLVMAGRSLPEAILMMIPEAWQKKRDLSESRRAFHEFHSCLMEPWDGPALIAFTDGRWAGAALDRNGLRPGRYTLTYDDRVILSSEAGVLPVDPALIKAQGRIEPGRVFLVDFSQGRLVPDDEFKEKVSRHRPYSRWLRQRLRLEDIPGPDTPPPSRDGDLLEPMRAFGYTTETLQFFLLPMVANGRDPVGSMGNDSALACLSDHPRLPYDYFKQLFAQVTNPPIDSIREEMVMTLECPVGPEGNLLDATEDHCRRLLLPHPILRDEEVWKLRHLDLPAWRTRPIDVTYSRTEGEAGLPAALDRICGEAESAVEAGDAFILLTDRAVSAERVPVSALLAVGAVHHHLVRAGKRTRVGLIVETGEAREVHHHCLLLGFGADAVSPWLAFEALRQARRDGWLQAEPPRTDSEVVDAYLAATAKGILKVMAKMGISTLQSYKGAQIFEAVGLGDEVVKRCFEGTPSRIQGVGWRVLAEEILRRHDLGYPRPPRTPVAGLPNPGEIHWRPDGERHLWNPGAISELQNAARAGDPDAYRRFSALADAETRGATLRGLLRFRAGGAGPAVPLEDVQPAAEIAKAFCTGAMSLGSISTEAHETLAVAMNRMGGKSNTGEGGEDPERFLPLPNGDSRRSAIKQVASGRFGVTLWYLSNADELQIKIAQGAKPGEGGELPGRKVDPFIARIRHSTPGVGLISPPPHHDIYSIEDLKQLIHDLKNANPSARVSVKLVSEAGVGTIAAGVVKAHADHILISGDGGGTGASPLTSIKHAGLPWELGLAETQQTLVLNDLRSRVVLQVDGGLRTGRDVVIAALLGAEEFGFSTAPLISLGCVMMRKCHLNTCPVGIATQDPELRKRFAGKPEHVVNYLWSVAEETRQMMAALGFRRLDEMIGRVDVLEVDSRSDHWKAQGVDLSVLLAPARKPRPDVQVRQTIRQDHRLEKALDRQLIEQARPALLRAEKTLVEGRIRNTHRTVGTLLSHEVVMNWGPKGLPDDTLRVRLRGSAGQSFGAFLASGVTLELEGLANDYVGKGLSGGHIVVYPPGECDFKAEENILLGNVALYGATAGEAFFRGRAAERFCVRNSGAVAVVEGAGDHACEYMTGGRAVILGPVGGNFGAGMSGGVAYLWDPASRLHSRCLDKDLELTTVSLEEDLEELQMMLERHYARTGSSVAGRILHSWPDVSQDFVMVVPREYRRIARARTARPASRPVSVNIGFSGGGEGPTPDLLNP